MADTIKGSKELILIAEKLASDKGIETEKYSLAINMKNKNMDINLISELTGLSIEEVKKL